LPTVHTFFLKEIKVNIFYWIKKKVFVEALVKYLFLKKISWLIFIFILS